MAEATTFVWSADFYGLLCTSFDVDFSIDEFSLYSIFNELLRVFYEFTI